MNDHMQYRETPRTGRAPGHHGHEFDHPEVDPSVLTDDRNNPDLLTFEKTWGHRLLAGIGVTMIVIAVILVAFCAIQLARIADVIAFLPLGSFALFMYGAGIIGGIALVVPAVIAIYVAKHPSKVMVAIVAGIIALVLVAAFFVYAVITVPQGVVAAILYSLLFAVLPVIYLIAAFKIKRSMK